MENPTATVTNVSSRPKSKWRPVALETVQFEKIASRKLGMNAQQAMKIAESLYSRGLISYPRTETNKFPKSMDLRELVTKHSSHSEWGEFASQILQDGPNPRQGTKSDEAHPPIHPTKCVSNLSGDDKKVYDYVTRHFLACLSKDAVGRETTAKIDIAGETFTAKGLVILEKNYLLVYIYEYWNAKLLPQMEVGQQFQPKSIEMVEGQTTAPPLLTEADLIGLMEAHGIGTDATHAEHIETIKNRNYVGLTPDKRFIPGQLGMGLVDGYDAMSFEIGLSKPDMRAATENELRLIAQGQKPRAQVVQEMLLMYREVFARAVTEVRQLDTKLSEYFGIERPNGGNGGGGGGNGGDGDGGGGGGDGPNDDDQGPPATYMRCRSCGISELVIKTTRNGSRLAGCMGYPRCTASLFFPNSIIKVEVTSEKCRKCVPDPPFLLFFKFKPGSVPPTIPPEYKSCLLCDSELNELLDAKRKLFKTQSFSSVQSTQQSSTARPTRSAPQSHMTSGTSHVTSAASHMTSGTGHVTSEDSDVFLTRSLAGAVTSHGLPTNSNSNPAPNCDCGRPAKLLTVSKEGDNKGRKFYGCDGRTCNYFCWEDQFGTVQNNYTRTTSQHNNTRTTSQNNNTRATNQNNDFRAMSQNNFRGPSQNRAGSNGLNYKTVTGGQSGGGYGVDLETSDTNIVCNCGTEARKLTVRKQGPNTGREFFTCTSSAKNCDFFMWADVADSGGEGANTWGTQGGGGGSWGPQGGNSFSSQNHYQTTQRNNNNNNSRGGPSFCDSERKCSCGLPAVTRTVKKEGPNTGRSFWTCSKPMSEKCDLFEWADDSAGGGGGGGWSNGDGGSSWSGGGGRGGSRKRPPPTGGGAKQRCCSVCRQPGHSKRTCPQNTDF